VKVLGEVEGKYVPHDDKFTFISKEVDEDVLGVLKTFVYIVRRDLSSFIMLGWVIDNDGTIYGLLESGRYFYLMEAHPGLKYVEGDDYSTLEWRYLFNIRETRGLFEPSFPKDVAGKLRRFEKRHSSENLKVVDWFADRFGNVHALMAETAGEPGSYKTVFFLAEAYTKRGASTARQAQEEETPPH